MGVSDLVKAAPHAKLVRKRNWESTAGKVTSTTPCENKYAVWKYSLEVSYEFSAQGLVRQGKYFDTFAHSPDRDSVAELFQPGQTISVHYDRTNPDICWIGESECEKARNELIWSGAFTLVGILVLAITIYWYLKIFF